MAKTADTQYKINDDYYAILGVDEFFTEKELKVAYRKLSIIFHPDKQPEHARKDAHYAFVRIGRAFDTLKDNTLRAIYDGERKNYFVTWFRRVRGRHVDYDQWKVNKVDTLRRIEIGRKYRQIDQQNQWKSEAQQKEEDRQREKKRRFEEHQQQQEQRRAEEQKRYREGKQRYQRNSSAQHEEADELEELMAEKTSMDIDFRRWEAKQKLEREREVSGREQQVRELRNNHEQAQIDLLARHRKELETLQKRNQKEFDNLKEKHDAQSEQQKLQRKLVRSEYELWMRQTESDIDNLRDGRQRQYDSQVRKRPTFTKTCFGYTKNGSPCKTCINIGRFCATHKDQQQEK
jgi:curved DNA-binding protein CbpA